MGLSLYTYLEREVWWPNESNAELQIERFGPKPCLGHCVVYLGKIFYPGYQQIVTLGGK